MNFNTLNGGLILELENEIIFSDIKKYSTNYNGNDLGMLWFMNKDGNKIIASNQKDNNSLYSIDIDNSNIEKIINEPCYGVLLDCGFLYYINEDNRKLYCSTTNNKNKKVLVNDNVENFIVNEDDIFYVNDKGINIISKLGDKKNFIPASNVKSLIIVNDELFFSDHTGMKIFNLKTNDTENIDNILPLGMNFDGEYLYYIDGLNSRNIYRMDIDSRRSLRICNESADFLHIASKNIYFCIDGEWYQMPIEGGAFEKVRI